MTTNEISAQIAKIKADALIAKNAAKATAEKGMKLIDGNFAARASIASAGDELYIAMRKAGYELVATSELKEALTRPGSAPVGLKMEKVTVTLAELRSREEARKAKLKALKDANKVAADAKKSAPKVEAPAKAPVVPMGLAGTLSAALKAKKAA